MDSTHKEVTIYDIAKKANVSAATVSRVITGSARVKPITEASVRSIMKELDYQPNLIARTLQVRETKTVGVILPDVSNPFFAEFFLEFEKCALKSLYTVYLCNTLNNELGGMENTESLYFRSLMARRVDAIILLGGRINDNVKNEEKIKEMNNIIRRCPVIMVNGRMKDVDAYIVRTDERAGFILMMNQLIQSGHKSIALLGGINKMLPADIKIRAYRDVLKDNNMSFNEGYLITEGFGIEDGEVMFKKLSENNKMPSAIMCINDNVAIGVLRSALKAGFKIPEELSITGFDDITFSKHLYPSLTTVSHDMKNLAKKTFDKFIDIKDKKKTSKVTVLPMTVIKRESSI